MGRPTCERVVGPRGSEAVARALERVTGMGCPEESLAVRRPAALGD
ncbi:MAG: hypothetical protein ACRDGN_16060 [bacterium]